MSHVGPDAPEAPIVFSAPNGGIVRHRMGRTKALDETPLRPDRLLAGTVDRESRAWDPSAAPAAGQRERLGQVPGLFPSRRQPESGKRHPRQTHALHVPLTDSRRHRSPSSPCMPFVSSAPPRFRPAKSPRRSGALRERMRRHRSGSRPESEQSRGGWGAESPNPPTQNSEELMLADSANE